MSPGAGEEDFTLIAFKCKRENGFPLNQRRGSAGWGDTETLLREVSVPGEETVWGI